MKEAFEKIKERLEAEVIALEDDYGDYVECIPSNIVFEIVNQVAEEYSHRNHDLVIGVSHRNDGWIPCKERLPNKSEKRWDSYLVQAKLIEEPFSAYWDGETWTDNCNCMVYGVIAWQPLPATYKPKGD